MRPGQRAALYLRVSSREQEDGHSLDGQLEDCRRYCDAQGYRVVRIIREVGSGRDNERPGLHHVAALGCAGAFDVLVLWRRDRLGRDVVTNALVERDLRDAGARIECVNSGPKERSDETELMDGLADLLAQYESRRSGTRIRMGLHTAARKGIWPTKPPFGYRRDPETDLLVIHPDEATRMRAAFAECLLGANRHRIGIALGTSPWNAMARLRNPAYKGEAVYGGQTIAVPAIVSPEVWERAQAAIDQRYLTKGRRPAPIPTGCSTEGTGR